MKNLSGFWSLIFLSLLAKMSFGQITKAPSYPLLTHNPYFSVWSNTDQLNASTTTHWSGVAQAMTGLIKVDDSVYDFMGKFTYGAVYKTILPASDESSYTCKYTTLTYPPGIWQNLNYNDSTWTTTSNPPFTSVSQQPGTPWTNADIWVRRKFNLTSASINNLMLKLSNDDNADVYINGVLAYSTSVDNHNYIYVPVTNNLVVGQNIIVVHCHNISGSSYLDFGLSQLVQTAPASTIVNAVQKSVTVTATQTTYTFTCGKVNLTVNFISPILLNDLALVSRPVSYISYKATANDGGTHDVKVYFGATTDFVRNAPQVMTGTKYTSNGLSMLKAGTVAQNVLNANGNELNWGYMYVSVAKGNNATQFFSSATPSVSPFSATDTAATTINNGNVLLNTVIPFGKVGAQTVEKVIEVGEDDIYTINYFGQNLKPWFKSAEGSNIENELSQADAGYASIIQRCVSFDQNMYTDATKAGGANYAKLCALAYRQAIASCELTQNAQGDLLYMQEEISSGGFVNTVDVVFPSSPLFILYNPKLMEGLLNGVFYYSGTNGWTAQFAPHDIGGYPIANGNHYILPMPVEETGNMILMTAAICKAENSVAYAKKNWTLLTKWANYLNGVGYNPPSQLTSDDFAGVIAHSVNLSAKLINAVAAYAGMARAMGDTATFTKFYGSAKNMAAQWVAAGDAGNQSLLAFDQPNTWSQKYNLIWDKVLGLKLFPQSVYDKEAKYYISQLGNFGVPLDIRQTYTKSDWSSWGAIAASNPADFQTLINPLYKLAITAPDRIPLTDFYQTTNGQVQSGFKARAVVGGFFMKMLQRNWELDTICSTPVTLNTTGITQNQATLHWSLGSSSEGFSFQGKVADSATWHTFTLPKPDSMYTITGLAPNTTYQWRIASICQFTPQEMSGYSAVQTFTTKQVQSAQLSVVLSPNPANNIATVRLANIKGPTSVKLLNLSGAVLWKSDGNLNSSIAIPLSKLRNGIYLVGVQNNGQTKLVKLIKTN